MIYAKCIRESQIAKDHEDFLNRQGEEYSVYCIGETTRKEDAILNCVPLNFIYDCLKYGMYIALVEVNNTKKDYPKKSSYMSEQIVTNSQKIYAILEADNKDTIDFVFKEVGDPFLVHDGYLYKLSNKNKAYFDEKMRPVYDYYLKK